MKVYLQDIVERYNLNDDIILGKLLDAYLLAKAT